jgi:hypothetical protein
MKVFPAVPELSEWEIMAVSCNTDFRRSFFLKNQPGDTWLAKTDKNVGILSFVLIPCELLLMGRRPRRSGSLRTYPCQPLPSHCPWQLPMQDIHLRRFRIRYISLCQRLLPTRSLQRICFGEKKKRVSISTRPHQVEGGVDAHVVALVSGFAPVSMASPDCDNDV